MIKVTTICDFAEENGISYITAKKRIEKSCIKPIGKIKGKTKWFNIYDHELLIKSILTPQNYGK